MRAGCRLNADLTNKESVARYFAAILEVHVALPFDRVARAREALPALFADELGRTERVIKLRLGEDAITTDDEISLSRLYPVACIVYQDRRIGGEVHGSKLRISLYELLKGDVSPNEYTANDDLCSYREVCRIESVV